MKWYAFPLTANLNTPDSGSDIMNDVANLFEHKIISLMVRNYQLAAEQATQSLTAPLLWNSLLNLVKEDHTDVHKWCTDVKKKKWVNKTITKIQESVGLFIICSQLGNLFYYIYYSNLWLIQCVVLKKKKGEK